MSAITITVKSLTPHAHHLYDEGGRFLKAIMLLDQDSAIEEILGFWDR